MRRLLTGTQMREADNFTINNLGIEQGELIARAGQSLAEEIIKRFDKNNKILFVCGHGNNGKDGIYCADFLRKSGYETVGKFYISHSSTGAVLEKYDLIVDCLLGTGLDRKVEGKYKTCIESINDSGAYVISCDVPSGLNANNGKVMGVCVNANLTVAIGELKTGYYLNDGIDYTGDIILKDIGISVWGEYPYIIDESDIFDCIKQRKRNSNKGNYGKAVMIGGSKKYVGGSVLTANALLSLKTGIGYTAICVPESLYNVYVARVPEAVTFTLKDNDGEMSYDEKGLKEVLDFANVIVFGNGIGTSFGGYENLKHILQNFNGKLVIDADGINVLSIYGAEILKQSKCEIIITPHIKEFSRLVGKTVEEVTNDSVNLAKDFAREYKVTVVLKSAVTVITDGENTALNITGNSGMAKAGSGDVLAGITAGLFYENNAFNTACASTYVFGCVGDEIAKKNGKMSVVPSEIIKNLPKIIKKFEK